MELVIGAIDMANTILPEELRNKLEGRMRDVYSQSLLKSLLTYKDLNQALDLVSRRGEDDGISEPRVAERVILNALQTNVSEINGLISALFGAPKK